MAISATAKEVYSQQFNTVLENDAASRCLEGFKKGMPPVLAVLDDKGRYVGMVSRRSVLRSRLDLSKVKVKSLMVNAPEVALGDSLSRIAKLMIGSGVRQLPVLEKNKIIGFVTDEAVIHSVVASAWGNNAVESVMTRAPHTMDGNRSVGAVLGLMREFGVSHVPIMDKGKLVGLVSVQDILANVYFPPVRMGNNDVAGDRIATLGVAAKGIMNSPVITVDPKKNLRDCEAMMHKHDISCLCVVDNDRLVGVVTKLDFLEPISGMDAAERNFTVQFGVKDIEIGADQQEFMMAEFDGFIRRFKEAFQTGSLFVYMKTHRGTEMRGTPMVHCRLQLRTVKGSFFASGEGWGIEPTFKVALDRLERRLMRSKELLEYNPRFAKDYLRKVGMQEEEE